MNRVGTFVLCLAGGLIFTATARAEDVAPAAPAAPVAATADNPYGVISARNIFGLLPPPTNNPDPKPPDPPTKITLTGIMNLLGTSQALFKTAGGPTKPNEPKERSYMLSEGQQEDDIEVIKIDDKTRTVTFNNHGVVQDILLANVPSGGPSGGGGATPASSPAGLPNFPMPRPTAGGNPGGGGFTFGSNPFGAGRNFNGSPANNFNGGAGGNGRPGFGSGGPEVNENGVYQPRPSAMSPEATAIYIEAQRAAGGPTAPILPPTPLTQQLLNEQGQH